jgi:transcriptional regulator with XRE-family HTH domain
MGNQPRTRQQLLPDKLLAIREFLKLGQAEMSKALQSEILSHSGRRYNLKPGRISEYENGEREPNLFVLIAYARLGQVHLESVADDRVTLKEFRRLLGKEGYSRSLFSTELDELPQSIPILQAY